MMEEVAFSSTPSSPKAKSAPSTPCNAAPIDFEQLEPNLNSIMSVCPASTMPPDISRNISATCRNSPTTKMMAANRKFGGSSLAAVAQNRLEVECSSQTEIIYNNDELLAENQNNSTPSSNNNNNHEQTSEHYLDELVRMANSALRIKDFNGALKHYDNCIQLAASLKDSEYLEKNFKLYCERAMANLELANYKEVIEDARIARNINPRWTEAYYLQGQAQFLRGDYAESLAVFSFGLAQEPNNQLLFDTLVKAALDSKIVEGFEGKYNIIKGHGYDKKAFIIMAVLGQELLSKGYGQSATIIIESAFKIEQESSCSPDYDANLKKFKSSILSTIAFAYCSMKDYTNAIKYMRKELELEGELEDIEKRCRILSNLGYTYFKIRDFDSSLESHRKQLDLAMRNDLFQQASLALDAIGHVHAAKNDFLSAQTSHTRCLELLKRLGDNYDFNQHRELLSIGHTHTMLGDYTLAEEKYNEAMREIQSSKVSKEEYLTGMCMLRFNSAYLALKKQNLSEAIKSYESVIKFARDMLTTSSPLSTDLPPSSFMTGCSSANALERGDTMTTNNSDNSANSYCNSISSSSNHSISPIKRKARLIEMRALNGMGQAFKMSKNFTKARECFQQQLRLAKHLKDKPGQSQALSNLAMTYQQNSEDYEQARKLFEENLNLVENDPLLKAYAHSYMGNIYFLLSNHKKALAHYQKSLDLFKNLDSCSSERKTIAHNITIVHKVSPHQLQPV